MSTIKIWKWFGANDNDAFVPEIWANESLMQLNNRLVLANLVHRDFENEVQEFGDVINTRRPAGFTAKRKVDGVDVTIQDATATKVQVPLDQHLHTSFYIYDGERSKSFQDLVAFHLTPAVNSLAQDIERILAGQCYSFLANNVGKLGTTPTDATPLSALNRVLNENAVPVDQRRLILTPAQEEAFLNVTQFTSANTVGDNGSALREANLGRKFGMDIFMSQNAPVIASGVSTTVTGAINHGGGYAAGTTSLAVDGFTGDIAPAGAFVTIAGDMIPHRVVSSGLGTGNTTSIVITPALKYLVADDAVVTVYTPGAVNLVAGYAAGYLLPLTVDGFSVAPQKNQMVAFGASTVTTKYSAIETPTTTSLVVNKALADAQANDAAVNVGPAGNYGFAFHRNALALVVRPLIQPVGLGVQSAVMNYNGLSVRVTITYDGKAQAHLITVDLLCGTAVLDANLGAVLMS